MFPCRSDESTTRASASLALRDPIPGNLKGRIPFRPKAQRPNKVEIIFDLVPPFHLSVHRYPVGQEDSPPIGGVPRSPGNSGHKGEESGIEGIGQVQGQVESPLLQLLREPPSSLDSPMSARAQIGDDPVKPRKGAKKIPHPWLGQDGYFGPGKAPAYRGNRRKAHDRIPHPVGRTDEDSPDSSPGRLNPFPHGLKPLAVAWPARDGSSISDGPTASDPGSCGYTFR